MKVLAVDDDVRVRAMLQDMIPSLGYECRTAANGREALGVLRENRVSIVVSDIRMPGMDGIELLKEIMENHPGTDVISLTGHGDEYTFTDMIKAGASDFIAKPFTKDELEAKLSRIVRERALKSEVERRGREYKEKSEALLEANEKLSEAIEELKQTQSYLLQTEKMACVGQLAAGVAHEINNPTGYVHSNLTSLGSYVDKILVLVKRYDDGLSAVKVSGNGDLTSLCEEIEELKKELKMDFVVKDFQKIIADSLKGTERIGKIVADLKSFSRIDEAEFALANINEGVESTLNVVWSELKYKCTVEKNCGDLPLMYCNLGQLNQVFMNLLVNAAQAIEEKGTIRIATRHVSAQERLAPIGGENGSIEVEVSDTGCGIPGDQLNRLFEPFFTTKPVGKGTGLGLSIVYDIVRKHDGEIAVQSEVGKGTTFTIRLPVRKGEDTSFENE
jgi:signal transduction histidine kinase